MLFTFIYLFLQIFIICTTLQFTKNVPQSYNLILFWIIIIPVDSISRMYFIFLCFKDIVYI